MLTLLFAAAIALTFTLVLTPVFAKAFRSLNLGQFVRADTPTTHVVKRGTPSMGGVVFITAAIIGYFGGHLINQTTPSLSGLLVIFMMVGLGLVGFIDDLLKVTRQNSLGLHGTFKIIFTVIVSSVFAVLAVNATDINGVQVASTSVSFIRDLPVDFVLLFGGIGGIIALVAWISLITVSTSNAVNLTDGLDGLAAGSSIFAIGSFIIIGFWQFNQSCFGAGIAAENMFKCYTVAAPMDFAVAAAAVVGALIGFLWWNTSPAQIIMGDTGSFALGGALAALAIVSRTELLLIFLGGLFLIVTSQVIMQRIYFKATKGKRIWRASPLHHHFEMKNWPEVTIVVRFWIISGLCVSAGVGIFYLEWLSL
ncbi:MAG TPA: phospho-N-acetylmuramoyl-pentapeptide-transferase [Terrimesophilobacter sp.]|nr:phospho-N-acetylmuramoyl-pentapeptide-transferase [Terrimesophilobacter sp.]HRQ00316.1 phospho-N-acetylmuramoyl-pentapeptide-transferase [Terrimesophilobacter sp.]